MPLTSLSTDAGALVITWSFSVPAPAVWAAFDDPALVACWLGQPVECDLRPGGLFVVDHGEGYVSRSVVTAADGPHRVVMTWEFPDEPESRISVQLHPSGSGTTMEFRHDDLGSLAGPYGPGWITHLTYLEAAVGGSPLPRSQFWPLHATVEALCAAAAPGAAAAAPRVAPA